MSENRRGARNGGGGARKFAATLAIAGGCAVVALAAVAFCKCRDAYLEQCVLRDPSRQIATAASPHIGREAIVGLFSLTNGCNLATIDFAAAREKILRRHPEIKSISVTRRLPDRVEIAVEERKPVARINCTAKKTRTSLGKTQTIYRWDVVDSEGIVFRFNQQETRLLPRIVEKKGSASRGERLSGRALAALRIVDMCARRDFPSISLLEVDTSDNSYLVAATADYDVIKIDWSRIPDPESEKLPEARSALEHIQSIVASSLAGPMRRTFVVSEDGRVNMLGYGRENETTR